MAGNTNSGQITPRTLRDEARFDLIDATYAHHQIAEQLAAMNRALVNAHRLVTNAAVKLDQAARREDGLPAQVVA